MSQIPEEVLNYYVETDRNRLFATPRAGAKYRTKPNSRNHYPREPDPGWYEVHVGSDKDPTKLPSEPDQHARGWIDYRYAYFILGGPDDYLPLRAASRRSIDDADFPKPVVFHSQPYQEQLSDIPMREDVFWFLRHRHVRHINVGRRVISILTKTEQTWPTVLALRDWERSHPYSRNRLRKRHPNATHQEIERRHAAAALRGVGLDWPGKPTDRLKLWPEVLRAIGIEVQLLRVP